MVNREYKQALYEYLLEYVTENKQAKFEEVLANRTRSLTVVLEDIFKSHNASAVLRTAECMGLQDVHVIEQDNLFNLNPYVLRGSGKWLTVHHHQKKSGVNNSLECLKTLKQKGYRILATTPHEGARNYRDVEIKTKTAVVFGAEENGISQDVIDQADDLIQIPMMGFTESFNISVSAAIVLEHYNIELRKRPDWPLRKNEIFELKLDWIKKSVSNIEAHIRKFDADYKHLQNHKN